MSTELQIPRAKKKRSILRWIAGAFVLLLCIFFFRLFGPNPSLIISKQTTYISEPLRPDGWPDYKRYVLEQRRKGVTTENNAAVLLIPALWPANVSRDQHERVISELGLDETPSGTDVLQSQRSDDIKKRILELLPPQNGPDSEPDSDAVINEAWSHAWKSQQLPPLAEWIAANQKPLNMIVAASRRSRLYMPSPSLLEGQEEPLFSMLLPGAQSLREAARGLALRAMQRAGENQLSDAWQDTLAIHRLAALQMQEPCSLVEQLVAMALSGIATQNTLAILSSDHLTKELAQKIQADLAALPAFNGVRTSLDGMERISSLDSITFSRLHGFDALSDSASAQKSGSSSLERAAVNGNIVLKRINYWCDRLVAIADTPRGVQRLRAGDQFESDIAAEAERVHSPKEIVWAFFSRDERSELIGAIYASLLLPAVEAATTAEDRTNSTLELTKIAAALSFYRVEHGNYPDTLDQLVPTTLKSLPVDLFNLQPIIYKRNDKGGYLLYSVGPNGNDDRGSNDIYSIFEGQKLYDRTDDEAVALREQIPKSADDLSILMPVPSFQLTPSKSP
jgi:hypothetical protein